MSRHDEDNYCPFGVSTLPTGDGVACGRLVDRVGQYCDEHEEEAAAMATRWLLGDEYARLYDTSASFHHGVDLLIRGMLPATLKGLAIDAEAADRQQRLYSMLMDKGATNV